MDYGVYLRDPIDEHAKMHELGIAHGHGGIVKLCNVWNFWSNAKNKVKSKFYYIFWGVQNLYYFQL